MAGVEALLSSLKIFPASPKDQEKIPLWLKFFCYDYTDSALLRAAVGGVGIGPMLSCIMVPAPKEFINMTDALYDTAIFDDQGKSINITGGVSRDKSLTQTLEEELTKGFGDKNPFQIVDLPTTVAETIGFGAKIDMDMSDTKFKGMSKRIYKIKLVFVARTAQDATIAGNICESFEALALPQARIAPLSKFVCHPPLWLFGIGQGNNATRDNSWSGQPQLSLLDQVTINRSALQDSYGIRDAEGNIKPIAYTANLTFVELEPALRSGAPQSTSIINRSTAFLTLGGSAIDLANGAANKIRGNIQRLGI